MLHKRAMDLAIAIPALVVVSPLLVGLGLTVRLTSRGPALFAQKRVGRNREPVRVLKLRTMVVDAESRGAHVTSANDPRITKLGAFLRRTKLDELPQLWNVVRGDMSLVGPRPEAPRYVAAYRPEWEPVFTVRPGITDPASLVFSDEQGLLAEADDQERAYVEAVLPEKIPIAIAGVEESSLLSDLRILWATAWRVLTRRSVEHPALERAKRSIRQLNRRNLP